MVTGAPNETLGEELASNDGCPVIDLCGATAVAELPAVLAQLDLLVSNDTGPIHVAAAVGTPVVGLYFSTAYFGETAPYGDGHLIVQVEPSDHVGLDSGAASSRHLTPSAAARAIQCALDPDTKTTWSYPHLSLYRSLFLSNGTVAYAPAEGAGMTPNHVAGCLGARGWERVFGLDPDEGYVAELADLARNHETWPAQIDASETALKELERHYRQAARLAESIVRAYGGGSFSARRVLSKIHKLMALDTEIEKLAGPIELVRMFGPLEVTDVAPLQHPELSTVLARKYRKLAGIAKQLRPDVSRQPGTWVGASVGVSASAGCASRE